MKKSLPLVYSCSGCSSAAQMANYIAVKMDRSGIAEMSCIAGVGSGVKPLVKTAQSGREIIALDGCALKCVQACLSKAGVRSSFSYVLSDYHVKKLKHQDFDSSQAHLIIEMISAQISEELFAEPQGASDPDQMRVEK